MNTLQMIKEDARNMHLLIAEDDLVMQALYKRLFRDIFAKFTIVDNGKKAYEYFLEQEEGSIDLIITDNYMPEMTGLELVQNIREKDLNVRIIVLTSEADYNRMKDYMLNGVDAILPKPFEKKLMQTVLQRTLHQINEKKLLENYIEQLEIMAKDNVVRKSVDLKKKKAQSKMAEEPKEKESCLVNKYNVRESIQDMENVDVDDLDTIGTERLDHFKESIAEYEAALCAIEANDIKKLRLVLVQVLNGIRDLIGALAIIGVFPIATNAAIHLIQFVEALDESEFEDQEKRELFIDILLSMLADFDKWIDSVFISKTANNIHYFDASFANTCLELEMTFKTDFKESVHDEDSLEFF